MAQKRTINLAIPEALLDEFNEVCSHYGHAKQKGLVLSAAILMFLEAHPEQQGRALERILVADVRAGIESMVLRAREQQASLIDAGAGGATEHPQAPVLAQAAKLAGAARHGLHKLPDLPVDEPEEAGDHGQEHHPPAG